MLRLIAAFLILWEPLRFAAEALGVFPTIAYRGTLAILELIAHGVIAAFSAAAGLALWSEAPDGRRLAALAVIAVAARTIQSLYASVLPDNTPPGTAPLYAGVTIIMAGIALAVLTRRP